MILPCTCQHSAQDALHGALTKFNHYIARDAQSGYRYREAAAMSNWLARQTQPEQLTLF